MYSFLLVIHVIVSIFLILVVLLQQGKGAGMGAAFGGASQTLFGTRGRTTPMQRITAVMAVMFMVLSVALASLSGGERSSLADDQPPPEQEAGMGQLGSQGTALPEEAKPTDAPQGKPEPTASAPVPVEAKAVAAPVAPSGNVPAATPTPATAGANKTPPAEKTQPKKAP